MSNVLSLKIAEVNDLLFERQDGNFELYGWLTESHLKRMLITTFGEDEVICNKTIPGVYGKPDCYLPKHNLIIEYDGTYHYTSAETIDRDTRKDESAKAAGLKVFRIPYFVQIQWDDLLPYLDQSLLTNKQMNSFSSYYPNGFVHFGCILPSDFCEVGLIKFKK